MFNLTLDWAKLTIGSKSATKNWPALINGTLPRCGDIYSAFSLASTMNSNPAIFKNVLTDKHFELSGNRICSVS